MNIQAMMKQAQKLQKEMMEAKDQVEKMEFEGKSSFVTVIVSGKKEIINIKIEQEQLEKDDIEMLQDMLVVAINEAMKKIDETMDQKMGKYTQGIPGIF